ncbi:MAG: FAD-dependent oxidoreductase [Deltaproteobacteria bacterium]|nr:FAD-dependent oxidoreductase [Deltaproteobacteria bacterium]
MKVAIVGSGIAGLGAARALATCHDVTMFEAADRAGGHVYTVDVGGIAVDMGFIVCNRERYPLFFRLLGELGIATRPTTMSFSVSLPREELEWGSESMSSLFADRRTLGSPAHWRFLAEVFGFLRRARRDLDTGITALMSLDEYVGLRTSRELRDRFIVPLAAALWSLAPERCGAFPADTFLRFLEQHGMLRAVRPLAWHTIVGGSRCYVDGLLAALRGQRFALELGTPVTAVARDARGVTVTAAGRERRFDRIVLATHADTALGLLAAPSADERRVLGAFRYSANTTVLHRDPAFMPRRRAAHAAWNYVADPDTAHVNVTYSMSRLQGLAADPPFLVTLNPRTRPRDVLHEVVFTHPQLDRHALAAQAELPRLGGTHRTYYAGAHSGFGFHEDGLRAGLAAAASLVADEHRCHA